MEIVEVRESAEQEHEVRRRFAAVFGGTEAEITAEPVEKLRLLLASVDEQVDTYEALGFMTPAEADEAACRSPECASLSTAATSRG